MTAKEIGMGRKIKEFKRLLQTVAHRRYAWEASLEYGFMTRRQCYLGWLAEAVRLGILAVKGEQYWDDDWGPPWL